ncbi:hypothetical protein GM418_14110 [Maribellus comscasis]|uniref:Uncharacterized protein n=1 Tax=Maribellus comscasis TaxID=2681766 RepID=A0A6I6JUK7_9BACT|nr:DUF6090 family protein [Maribellus comscasis]QGY44760.1 hypothetical protein GM418_14110 [Maribellus comscasis]
MRYKLAAENRVAKYLRYAIGEILLVVLGILIALQINNWNEKRKIRNYEQKIITDILQTIESDLGIYQMLFDRLDVMEFGVSNLYRLIGKNESSIDSIQKYLPYLAIGIRYGYDSGAYESLKSVGLDKITNDSIRVGLARLYDFSYPRTDVLIENDYKKPSVEAEKLLDKFWHSEVEMNSAGETVILNRIKIDDPYHNQDFMKAISTFSTAYKIARLRIQFVVDESEKVKESLENYINKY